MPVAPSVPGYAAASSTATPGSSESVNHPNSTSHRYLIVGLVVLLALAATGVFVITEGGHPTTGVGPSPALANAALFEAATAAGSFHYVDSDSSDIGGARSRQVETGDVGPGVGIQFTVGDLGNSEIIVVHSTAYLLGDETTLETLLEFSKPEAIMYADKWISFTPNDSFYFSVADLVTAESFWGVPRNNPVDPLAQLPESVSGPFVMDGVSTQVVSYSIHDIVKSTNSSFLGSSTIRIATKSKLPSSCDVQTTGTYAGTPGSEDDAITFSQWGEAVPVNQPAGALPFSSLSASTPG